MGLSAIGFVAAIALLFVKILPGVDGASLTAVGGGISALMLALATGVLLTLAGAFACAAMVTRVAGLAAMSGVLLSATAQLVSSSQSVWRSTDATIGLSVAGAANTAMQASATRWQLGSAALCALLLATSWLCWLLFHNRVRRIRANQAFPTIILAATVLTVLSCLVPPAMVWPTLIGCAALTVPITAVTLLDLLMFARPGSAGLFAAGWLLMLTGGGLQLAGLPAPIASGVLALAVALIGVATLLDWREAFGARAVAHQKSFDAARKYRHVYYSVPVALVSSDSNGQVLRWNDMADVFFSDWLTKGRLNYLSSLLGRDGMKLLLRDAATLGRHTRELRLNQADGSHVYALDALAVGGSIEVSLVDVSERSRLSDVLEHMAYHDFLTDTLNRRGLERHVDDLLRDAATQKSEPNLVSAVYIDLDRFKSINDVFGHLAGDGVVVDVARRIKAVLPGDGQIGRLGGDEFLVILVGLTFDDVHALAGRIMTAISGDSYFFEGSRLEIEASIGVVTATESMTTRELIGHADDACALSKRNGRSKITALQTTSESLNNYRAEMYYGTQLKSNLPIDQLRLFAQPIVPLRPDSTLMSYEVLLRTEDEHGQIRAPGRLLAAAERQGAMAILDRHVLSQSIEHLAAHREFLDGLGYMSINLSGMSLNDESFVKDAVAMISAHPEIAPTICLEITESIALYDMKNTRRFVDQMRSIGVSVALDDFGAGYTSFAYLKELPATLVKIDGQFILDIARDTKQRGIVRAIQQLSGELGMQCVAEWVEDVPTLRTLLELDIDYAQGYVLSRAQPLAHWLTHPVDLSALTRARRGLVRPKGRAVRERGKVVAAADADRADRKESVDS